ncbi:extracellular calcium-sensing receptor-like [Hyperolius riggenbachi]|uniref:extracellular calcium-sensing receptor-like n=1 Tax=Hyperolius riggenbachi TaxID=752182 RepID=UPI0035A2907B
MRKSFRAEELKPHGYHLESFQQIQVLIFAIEEINHSGILQNITLGLQIHDACNVLQGVLQIVTGTSRAIPNYRCLSKVPLSGIIGAALSTHSLLMAHILGLYRYPQIQKGRSPVTKSLYVLHRFLNVSHFSTSPLLSDRRKFLSFFRTVPSDEHQSHGLSKLLLHFGWIFVGLVAVDNDYGQQGIQLVRQDIVKAGACVAFIEYILIGQANRNAPHITQVIKKSSVNAVVLFSSGVDLVPIFIEMINQNVNGKVLIASEGWSTSTLFSNERFTQLLFGTVGLTFYSGRIPGFAEFINKVHPSSLMGHEWVKVFWEQTFSCRFPNNKTSGETIKISEKDCTKTENLEQVKNAYTDVSNLRTTNKVYMAVHVLARALEDLRQYTNGNGSYMAIQDFKPWELLHFMKNVRVKLSNGRELYFDKNGNPPAVYDIINWQMDPNGTTWQVNVGSYDNTVHQVFNINSSALVWATGNGRPPCSICSDSCPTGFWKVPIRGQPICCYDCVLCPQGEISNETDALGCFGCPWDKWPDPQKTKCLQKTTEYLSYEDLLGTTLAVTSVLSSLVPGCILRLFFLYRSSPMVKANNYSVSCLLLGSLSLCFLCSLLFIGYPQTEKCLIRQTAFGLVFSLCVSCVLAKTLMVVFVFMATRPASKLKTWARPKVSYLMIIVCFILQLIFCIAWLSIAPPFSQYKILPQPVIIVECSEGSPFAFWTMLGYLFLLATISFMVAFLARRLPGSFNEAQYITFSMLAFLSVWTSFIPASLSAQGKYTVAMEIFAILASSWALVICMFLPKCYIILFRPDMNTRDLFKKETFFSNSFLKM